MYGRLVTGLALLGLALCASSALADQPGATGQRPRAFLGIALDMAREGERAGAAVREVTPDSPAAKAGLQPGDLIVKVGERDVKDPEDLMTEVVRHKPGEALKFHVVRAGQERDVTVTLGERPARAAGEAPARGSGFLGVLMRPLTPEAKLRLGVPVDVGVVVAEVMADGPAARAGLRRGDVITSAGGKAVTNPDELRQEIQQVGPGKEIPLTLLRGQQRLEIRARLDEMPVEGITLPGVRPGGPLGGPFTSRYLDADKVGELERRVAELERRVRELEQKRPPQP
jgi:S1-C subfamily serine protease